MSTYLVLYIQLLISGSHDIRRLKTYFRNIMPNVTCVTFNWNSTAINKNYSLVFTSFLLHNFEERSFLQVDRSLILLQDEDIFPLFRRKIRSISSYIHTYIHTYIILKYGENDSNLVCKKIYEAPNHGLLLLCNSRHVIFHPYYNNAIKLNNCIFLFEESFGTCYIILNKQFITCFPKT